MFNIEKYLKKFSKNIDSIEAHKKQIIEIIEKNTQVRIPAYDIEYKDFTIYTKSSPFIKNKIFIFKDKILEDLRREVSLKIIDIK